MEERSFSCLHVHQRPGSGMLLTPSGSVHPADGDWLLRWRRRRVHAVPMAGAWPFGGTCLFGDSSMEGGVGDPGSPHACGMVGRETPATEFCRVANGTWGRSRCTPEGCGSMFSSTVSVSYHMPGEMLCSLLTPHHSYIHLCKWLDYIF